MTGDIKIINQIDPVFSYTQIVASGTTASINPGEPTKEGSGGGSAAIMVDADGTTTQRFSGVAKSQSTEVTATAGLVTLFFPAPAVIYQAKAKSAAAADTQAEINALIGKRVIFDLTSSVWTIDTAAADSATNCVVIIGGEYQNSLINFAYSPSGLVTE